MATAISTTAVELARELIRTRDFSLCPILADAMQDAGAGDEGVRELRAEQVFGRRPFADAVGKILINLLGVQVAHVGGEDTRNPRRKSRRLAVDVIADDAAAQAVVFGRAWVCRDGGSVANKYGYPAATDGVLAAAVFDQESNTVRVRVWAGELPANKVTRRGVAALFGYGDLCDQRVSDARRDAAADELFAAVRAG